MASQTGAFEKRWGKWWTINKMRTPDDFLQDASDVKKTGLEQILIP